MTVSMTTNKNSPYSFPITFQSQELALVECLFRRVKLAHVDILFIDLP